MHIICPPATGTFLSARVSLLLPRLRKENCCAQYSSLSPAQVDIPGVFLKSLAIMYSTMYDIIKAKQNRQCMYKRNMEARSYNHCCSGKAISITYSECVFVALFIQHAMRMRRFIFISVSSLTGSNVFKLSHKRHDFRGGKLFQIEGVLWTFSTTFV